MLIPYEDKVAVITPINILFIGGGEFGSLMKIKLMLLPQPTYCSLRWRILTPHEDKVDGCYYPSQHIVQNGWQNLMWWWSWCDDVMMWWCDDVMMWWCDDVMMWWCDDVMMWWCDDVMMVMVMVMVMVMMMMMMMIMTIVSVEQRSGWGEHVSVACALIWTTVYSCSHSSKPATLLLA